MTQVYHKRSEVEYIKKTFNGRYDVMIPSFQRYPRLDYEPERCFSMEENLKQGDVLFDIGVSDGWVSAIYSKFVGPENMCLFEPSSQAWANIKSDWDANKLAAPLQTFWGFVSDRTQIHPSSPLIENERLEYRDGWPAAAYDDTLIEEMCFRSLISTGNNIPQITVDDFVDIRGIVPNALSIDVEGAELLVLKGAQKTLDLNHPLIWLSLHDINGALTYDYHSSKKEVFDFLESFGYKMTWLEDYGDSHWLCQ